MKEEWEDSREDPFVVLDLNEDEDDDDDREETSFSGKDADFEGGAQDPERTGGKASGGKTSGGKASGGKASGGKRKKGGQAGEEEEGGSHWQKELLSWVMTFVIAIGAALLLKNFIIINATVPTGSMEHTIEPGDNLFGFRLAYLNSEPERGDIIIFKFPDDESEKYVKRVIGLPGEKIRITDGKVYINDSTEPLQEDYLKEEWIRATGPYEFEIPEGSYFVMGDNRNNSYDSRYWQHTFVTKDEIIGEALFIYYPFSHFGKLE